MAKMKINIGTPDSPNWIILDAKQADMVGTGGYLLSYNATSNEFEISYNGTIIGRIDNIGNLRIKGQIIEE